MEFSTYAVVADEIGASGTPHFQITLVVRNATSCQAIKKKIDNRIHIEYCKSVFDSIRYCKKDGEFVESGKPPVEPTAKGQMEKDVWKSALDSAVNGDLHAIPPRILLCHIGSILKVQTALQPELTGFNKIIVFYLVGPSGSGKSMDAHALLDKDFFSDESHDTTYFKKPPGAWFDPVAIHKRDFMIAEELDHSVSKLAGLYKQLTSGYSLNVEFKGGLMAINLKGAVITSNIHYCQFWPSDVEPFKRRMLTVDYAPLRSDGSWENPQGCDMHCSNLPRYHPAYAKANGLNPWLAMSSAYEGGNEFLPGHPPDVRTGPWNYDTLPFLGRFNTAESNPPRGVIKKH